MKLTPLENWIIDKTGIDRKDRLALEAYQLNQLKEALYYSKKNSRFYQEHLKEVDIESIHTIKDFESIPFTFSEDIKKQSLDFLCVPQREIKRIVTLNTSGTSGDEKRIYFTHKDLELTVDFFQIGMSCLTDETDRVLVLLPGEAYGSIGDLLKKALTLSNIPCFVKGVLTDVEETAKYIEENQITCIVGIPLQILYLSRMKSEIFRKRIRKVLLSTDYVPEVLVSELAQLAQCKVFNHYGMTEMGYGGGVECEALKGYHMREGDLFFEIIDPDSGKVVEDGQYGEVVFTTFKRQAMPLIRYRTGDMAAFSNKKCECGAFLKTMHKVTGRINNKVTLKNGGAIHLRELDELILKYYDIIDYKAILKAGDHLVLLLRTSVLIVKNSIEKELIKSILEKIQKPINISIIWMLDDGLPKISNSMMKRKIVDFRKGDL
ncbi:MAG: AMP-binding protein [Firmicutes bacterium HGW-Firmicutes-7]|nr:MAG: AMP-binding protein [Firmicutes bacterium HGW-Firmicutes-7]